MSTPTPSPAAFIVNSPEELARQIKESPAKSLFAILSVGGPQVVVRTFQYKGLSLEDLKPRIQSTAVEILAAPLAEVELDYQVFETGDKLSGVFFCMPRKLLKEYFDTLAAAKLIPVKMTASILGAIESFCQDRGLPSGRVGLLDLSEPCKIQLAIFLDGQCELIREIPYDNTDEARVEIIQTLRSACAASHIKEFERIYCAGDWHDKDSIIQQIEKTFNAKIERDVSLDARAVLNSPKSIFHLNLLKRYAMSLDERHHLAALLNKILVVFAGVIVFLTAFGVYNVLSIGGVKSSFKASDYGRAQQLEQKLKTLK